MDIYKNFCRYLISNGFSHIKISAADVFFIAEFECYPYFIPVISNKFNNWFVDVKFSVNIPKFNKFYADKGRMRASGFPMTMVVGNTTTSISGMEFCFSDSDNHAVWFEVVRNKLLYLNDVMPKNIASLNYGLARGEIGESGIKHTINNSSSFQAEYNCLLGWVRSNYGT